MKTEVIKIDSENIKTDRLKMPAQIIRNGGLVAFPTETVYGLGANALDETAVYNIFKAKGRPSDNPLIVHIADKNDICKLTRDITAEACKLMDAFWPGPLTLIMKKSDIVPCAVTAGLDTVAVRMPSHPVALALISLSGLPIAAPSANTSGKPSPTCAAHVMEDLGGKIDAVIDGGRTNVGLESTVLDLTVSPPVMLRPGGVTPSQLNEVLHPIIISVAEVQERTGSEDGIPKSPGLKYTHYSPNADMIVLEGDLPLVVEKIKLLIEENKSKGLKVGVLATDQTKNMYEGVCVISSGDRDSPETIASNLFSALREFDRRNVQIILAEAIDSNGIGLAVMNRLKKAAGYNIIRV